MKQRTREQLRRALLLLAYRECGQQHSLIVPSFFSYLCLPIRLSAPIQISPYQQFGHFGVVRILHCHRLGIEVVLFGKCA